MQSNTFRDIDAAESTLASYWQDVVGGIDDEVKRRESDEVIQYHKDVLEQYGREIALEVIRDVFLDMAKQENPALCITAFLISAGFTGILNDSLEKIRRRYRVTKQAVSKQVTYYRDKYGFRAVGNAKSDNARKSYRDIQLSKACEPKKEDPEEWFRDFFDRQEPSFLQVGKSINSAWVRIYRILKYDPIKLWRDQERESVRRDLKPLVDFYNSL